MSNVRDGSRYANDRRVVFNDDGTVTVPEMPGDDADEVLYEVVS